MSSTVSYPSPLTWDEFLTRPFETRNAALAPGDTLRSPLLDGFAVPVDELFRR